MAKQKTTDTSLLAMLRADDDGMLNLGAGKVLPLIELREALVERFGETIVTPIEGNGFQVDMGSLPKGVGLCTGFSVFGVEPGVSPIAPYLRTMLAESTA